MRPDQASSARPSFPGAGHDHGVCFTKAMARAETIFEGTGLRLTPLRQRVLAEIAASHTAIGAYDLIERLARNGERRLAPISVYRALDNLLDAGLVHRLVSRNAFFACHGTHGVDGRPIVMSCDGCGTVSEIESRSVFAAVARLAQLQGFVPSGTLIEVAGQCADCASANR